MHCKWQIHVNNKHPPLGLLIWRWKIFELIFTLMPAKKNIWYSMTHISKASTTWYSMTPNMEPYNFCFPKPPKTKDRSEVWKSENEEWRSLGNHGFMWLVSTLISTLLGGSGRIQCLLSKHAAAGGCQKKMLGLQNQNKPNHSTIKQCKNYEILLSLQIFEEDLQRKSPLSLFPSPPVWDEFIEILCPKFESVKIYTEKSQATSALGENVQHWLSGIFYLSKMPFWWSPPICLLVQIMILPWLGSSCLC